MLAQECTHHLGTIWSNSAPKLSDQWSVSQPVKAPRWLPASPTLFSLEREIHEGKVGVLAINHWSENFFPCPFKNYFRSIMEICSRYCCQVIFQLSSRNIYCQQTKTACACTKDLICKVGMLPKMDFWPGVVYQEAGRCTESLSLKRKRRRHHTELNTGMWESRGLANINNSATENADCSSLVSYFSVLRSKTASQ